MKETKFQYRGSLHYRLSSISCKNYIAQKHTFKFLIDNPRRLRHPDENAMIQVLHTYLKFVPLIDSTRDPNVTCERCHMTEPIRQVLSSGRVTMRSLEKIYTDYESQLPSPLQEGEKYGLGTIEDLNAESDVYMLSIRSQAYECSRTYNAKSEI